MILLYLYLLFANVETQDTSALLVLLLLFGCWIYVTIALAKPASTAGKNKAEARLKQALTQFPAQCKAAGKLKVER